MGRNWFLPCFPVIVILSALTLRYLWHMTEGYMAKVYIASAMVILELGIILFLLLLVFWGYLV